MIVVTTKEYIGGLLKRFLGGLLCCLVIIALVGGGLYRSTYNKEIVKIEGELSQHLAIGRFYLENELQRLTSDLELIATSAALQEFLGNPSVATRDRIELRFTDFANYRRSYDQIRVLDSDGHETIRINYASQGAVVVPEAQLQDKSARYYYRDAVSLPPGSIYISSFDLNIENGKLEIPYKPVIRLATALYDRQGELQGVLVLNYLGDRLLQGLDDSFVGGPGRLILVNDEGFYLKGLLAEQEWGFMLAERSGQILSADDPELWAAMQNSPEGVVETRAGVFAYQSLALHRLYDKSAEKQFSAVTNAKRWTLLAYMPAEIFAGTMQGHFRGLLQWAVISVLLSALISFLYARLFLQRMIFNRRSRQLNTALDHSPLGIALASGNGVLEYASQAFCAMLAVDPAQVNGLHLRELKSLGFTDDLNEDVIRAIDDHNPYYRRFYASGREKKTVEYELIMSRQDEGAGSGQLVILLRDVTRIAELEQQLEQKNKMQALGTMAGGMAHNFNNNLSIILGSVELAERRMGGNEEASELLGNVKTAVLNSRELIQKILIYSRKQDNIKKPEKIVAIVDETLMLLRSTIPATVQLDLQVSSESRTAWVDAHATQIQEVLINLCTNAVHAMDEKGKVRIGLELVDIDEEEIPASFESVPGKFVRLSVEDSGHGMSPETQRRIFDLFFTTKEADEGTGIGLSTVQGIIADHRGFIKVRSRVGAGSVFYVYLPVIGRVEEPRVEKVSELFAGSERILFVDDDPVQCRIGAELLKEAGYRVTTATGGIQAKELFEKDPDRFDMVISNETMPVMTGHELIAELKRIKPGVLGILCTGYNKKISDGSGEQVVDAMIMKPYTFADFLTTLREVFDGQGPP